MALSVLRRVAGLKVRLPSVELGRWSLRLSYVGDEGRAELCLQALLVHGPCSLWTLVLLQASALPQCVAWSLPPRTPSEILSRGRRALSYRADVLLSRNWNPPRKPEGGNNGARPMRGRSRRSPRSVTLAYSPSSREGKTRCGSRQRPPRRGKEKFVTSNAAEGTCNL